MRARTFSLLLALLLLPSLGLGAQLTGNVVRIVDGDTLVVLDADKTQTKVRLAGIDCPERGQPWGSRAREALAGYTFAKQVTVEWDKLDRYGRTVGTVIADSRNVNLALVRDGMCRWYRKYADEQSPTDRVLFEAAETQARKERGRGCGPTRIR